MRSRITGIRDSIPRYLTIKSGRIRAILLAKDKMVSTDCGMN